VDAVSHRPFFLIERLDHVVVLGQRLAKSNGEHRLAIGQVTQDFTRAPFAGSARLLGSFLSYRPRQGIEPFGRGRNHLPGILPA
jgi:hypothetical protein